MAQAGAAFLYHGSVAQPFEAGELLDEPAVVAIRRIALVQTERVRAAWLSLAVADPKDRDPDGAAAEALHEFRVALRSLRSWLRAHDDALQVPKKVRRRLRSAAWATNASRDAEVLSVSPHRAKLVIPVLIARHRRR